MHVRHLPSFGGRINARDCELLMSYLTVPYLRIPLCLAFFATPERIHSLGNHELRSVLDGGELARIQASLTRLAVQCYSSRVCGKRRSTRSCPTSFRRRIARTSRPRAACCSTSCSMLLAAFCLHCEALVVRSSN